VVQIKDYKGLIEHISKVLRPGGMIILGEFSFAVFASDGRPIEVAPDVMEPPWMGRWMALLNTAFRRRGVNTDVSNHMVQWVEEHGAFENVVGREYIFPISPWAKGDDFESVKIRHLGELGREDVMVRSLIPMASI